MRKCISTAHFSVKLNGSLVGCFSSGRGLRQGDPIVPYIFLLAMEDFTALFQNNIDTMGFVYHPKCEKLRVSHLNFPDDMFILSAANEDSFRTIKTTMDEFEGLAGLKPNLQKSQVFLAGIEDEEKHRLCDIMQMASGELPVKYLGLPLITTRLTAKDCMPIFHRIQKKLKSWDNMRLSYAGSCNSLNLCRIVSTYIGLVFSSFLKQY